MALTSAGKQKSRAAITVLSVAFSIAYIGGIYAGGYVLELRNLCYMMIVGAAIQFAGYLVAGEGWPHKPDRFKRNDDAFSSKTNAPTLFVTGGWGTEILVTTQYFWRP